MAAILPRHRLITPLSANRSGDTFRGRPAPIPKITRIQITVNTPALAECIPPIAVRLRRDFGQLLNLIRAHAILHQATRARDSAGRILATLEDYEAVRDLLAEILAEGVEATVAPAIRETVEAISRILAAGSDEVSLAQLAQVMGLDKSAVSRRAAAAVQQGFLWNREDRKGRPARLCFGEPIPAAIGILPTREVLHGCSVDRGDSPPSSPLEGRTEAGSPGRSPFPSAHQT